MQMDKVHLASSNQISVASLLGYEHHPFWVINVDTVLNTWVVLGIIVALAFIVQSVIHRHKKPPLLYSAILFCGEFFIDTCTQALGFFSFAHTIFIAALFIFILLCNTLAVIPWLEEPSVDINTTLALSIIAFLYVQSVAIYQHGIVQYLKNYCSPFFFMMPLNVISRLTSIVSMALRLCGNIFAGAIIITIILNIMRSAIIWELFGLLSGLNLLLTLFFVLFEGTLQAFIFSILSLTYISSALQSDGGH